MPLPSFWVPFVNRVSSTIDLRINWLDRPASLLRRDVKIKETCGTFSTNEVNQL